MFTSGWRWLLVLACAAIPATARADDAVTLKYKLAKGDSAIYRSTTELKQTQMIMNLKIENTMKTDDVSRRTVDDVAADGKVQLTSKNERLKVAGNFGAAGKFEFDSKSAERDKGSLLGGALTPLYERLSGAQIQLVISPLGNVAEVKGYKELVADVIKDNPIAEQFGAGSEEAAKIAFQEQFVVFSDKPVKPGDKWEVPYDLEFPKLGKAKGKVQYVYEGPDKVGERKTARIGVTNDLSFELNVDMAGTKVTGTISTSSSSGTIQFDLEAGRIVSAKKEYTMSGNLSVDAGGMIIPVQNEQTQTIGLELLEKLPE